MNIVFRAEASLQIGSGHVMRCLTLAEACRQRGAIVTFVCRTRHGHLGEIIRQRGFAVTQLGGSTEAADPGRPNWLGAETGADAIETTAALRNLPPQDWLIADNYAIDASWEGALRAVVPNIMVVDDLANRQHDCDILLDQNLIRAMETRYDGKAPGATLLLGPRYALLREDYQELRHSVALRTEINRILIYFGGSDLADLTGASLRALLSMAPWHPRINVVLSPGSPNFAAVQAVCQAHDNIMLHTNVPSLASLMLDADLALGAVGATSWERLCLGLPTLGITIARNQEPVAERLQDAGLMFWLGNAETVTEAAIVEALNQLRVNSELASISQRSMEICDGAGTARVISNIWSHSTPRSDMG
ncbi:MAG: UDP-2,4-diacetamido-2,4,6-trideoxy-beta-L-altropyranose hydrolase [Cypionkella sp.]